MNRRLAFVSLVQTAGLVTDLHRSDRSSQAVWYVWVAWQIDIKRVPADLENAAWELVDNMQAGQMPPWAVIRESWVTRLRRKLGRLSALAAER